MTMHGFLLIWLPLGIIALAAAIGLWAWARTPLTYARTGGPPRDWQGLEIINLDTGARVPDVVECNSREGWALVIACDSTGHPFIVGDDLAMVRIRGRFLIRRAK